MKRVHVVALALALVLTPTRVVAWDNKQTHRELTQGALLQFPGPDLERHIEDTYGLGRGIRTRLAVQTGFDDEIDQKDLLAGPHPSRYERSQSLLEWPPIGKPPEDVRIRINRCDGGCDPSAVERFPVEQFLRAGVWAEDNPNVRASHHFHDPEKLHNDPDGGSVPPSNRGLDNTDSRFAIGDLKQSVAKAVTRLLRGGGTFELFGRSALDRGLDLPAGDPAGGAEPLNFSDLVDAERYLFAAAQSPGLEREHYFALHFLAIGAVLHLLEDMGSVAHVRNDFLSDHVKPEILGPLAGPSLEGSGQTRQLIEFAKGLGLTDLSPSRPRLALAAVDPGLAAPYAPGLPLVGALDPVPLTAEQFWGALQQRSRPEGHCPARQPTLLQPGHDR